MYNASKAAVNLLSDNLRIELAPFDVQVITVSNRKHGTSSFVNKLTISRSLPVLSERNSWITFLLLKSLRVRFEDHNLS